MQKKYFKCYFCKTGNSHTVPIEQKGKECRCCQAYNYFFNNNNTQNNNNKNYINKNQNNNKYHNNDTQYNNQNHNGKYYNKKYFKKKKANNNYGSNNNSFRNENNRRNNNQLSYLNSLINRIFLNDNLNSNNDQRSVININRNNFTHHNSHNNDIKEEKKIIKYSWLKLEKLSEELKNKKKEDYECTICLDIIKLNQDINILKCGHIFHYKCMESLIDHHLNCCPNCRCDIKTGKKQANHQINEINDYDFFPYTSRFLFDIGNEDPFDY